jgi:YjbE family integral membrane protein
MLSHLHVALIGSVLSIILINLVLSGDNAVVIAMASRRLSPRQRRIAILAGGIGATVLRVVFTVLATLLLGVPFLQLVGGTLLVWVAYRLLAEDGGGHDVQAAGSLASAIQTIVLADFLMSLDNVLAVGGASDGRIGLMIFGLIVSMPIILLGSSLIARLMARFGWLPYLGAVVLTVTAARMAADDEFVLHQLSSQAHLMLAVLLAVVFSLVAVLPSLWRARAGSQQGQSAEHA